jgi:hypothetical protein
MSGTSSDGEMSTFRELTRAIEAVLCAVAIAAGVFVAFTSAREAEMQRGLRFNWEFVKLSDLWLQRRTPDEIQRALERIEDVTIERLNDKNVHRRVLVRAELQGRLAVQLKPAEAAGIALLAHESFESVLALCPYPSLRTRAEQGLAHLHLQTENWPEALLVLDRISGSTRDADVAASTELVRARCLFELNDPSSGHALLDSLQREDVPVSIRTSALLLGAEQWLLNVWKPDGSNRPLTGGEPVALQNAQSRLTEALHLMDFVHPDRAGALHGLLKISLQTNDRDEASRQIKTFQNTVIPSDERVRSYSMFSKLAERQGDVSYATTLLEYCVLEHPSSVKTMPVYDRLFRLYTEQEKWADALGILDRKFSSRKTRECASEIIEALGGASTGLVVRLPLAEAGPLLSAPVRNLLLRMERPEDRWWREVDLAGLHIRGVTAFFAGDYRKAENDFLAYAQEAPQGARIEETLYYDLLCAVRLHRDPVTRAQRANRYLAGLRGNDLSPQVTGHLMQAYYDMNLYDAMLEAGKTAFTEAVTRLEGNSSAEEPEESPVSQRHSYWLQTVAQVAQCYSKQSDFERANRLFRSCMPRHSRFDCPSSVYLDWAATARGLNQSAEALRRLEVAHRAANDPGEIREIQFKQDLYKALQGDKQARSEARSMAESLGGDAGSGRTDSARLIRQLYENDLGEAMTAAGPEAENAILEMVTDLGQGPWIEKWLISYLNRELGSGSHGNAARILDSIQFDNRSQSETNGPVYARAASMMRDAGRLASLGDRLARLEVWGDLNE